MFAEPEPKAPGRKPRGVDWRQAAKLLAHGSTNVAVAKRLGCSPKTLSKKRNHDPQFRQWMAAANPDLPPEPAPVATPVTPLAAPMPAPRHGLAEDPAPTFERTIPAQPRSSGDRIKALRQTLYDAIEAEVRGGNVRVILWLADRLKLVTPPNERTPGDELRAILGGMSSSELEEFSCLTDE